MKTDEERDRLVYDFYEPIITSFWYNRSLDEMQKLTFEVHERVKGSSANWTDDGDIAYGALVLRFGDYGTSPRSGWFGVDWEPSVLKVTREQMDEFSRKEQT